METKHHSEDLHHGATDSLVEKMSHRGSFAVLFVAAFLVVGLALYGLFAVMSKKDTVAINPQRSEAAPPTRLGAKLNITVTPTQVAPGGSYVLRASYTDGLERLQPYLGKLNYNLRFCPTGGTVCSTSTGPWGDYTLTPDPTNANVGMVIVNLPSNTAQGIYNASFTPIGLRTPYGGWLWSDEVAITVGATPAPVTTGNLILNGDFEQPNLPNNVEGWDTIAHGTPGLAWRVNWTNPAQHTLICTGPRLEIQAGVNGWAASSGERYAELDADCGTGADRGIVTDALVDISQTIATQVGGVYKVSFAFAARPNTNQSDNILSVYFGGQRIAQINNDGGNFNNPEWHNYSYYVTATSSQTEVRFSGRDSNGDSYGIFVDGIDVRRIQ